MRVRFGQFELDEDRCLLRQDGARVRIRPKVFDLLVLLVHFRERVVRREELVERLWGGMTVGPGSLSGLVNELRQILGEDGRSPSSIRTVHARGYQFVAPVMGPRAVFREARVRPDLETESLEIVPHSVPAKSDPTDLASLANPLRSAIERVRSNGARALLVEGLTRPVQATLLGRVRGALERERFAVESIPLGSRAEYGSRGLVDRICAALVEHHGVDRIRAMLPVHARCVLERCARREAVRVVRGRDPLAARQQEEGIWRGLARVLRELARTAPIALVVEEVALAANEETSPLPELLRLLGNARVFLVGSLARSDHAGLDEVAQRDGSRIEIVEIEVPDRRRLDSLIEREGGSALPPVLADALLAHARQNGDIDLAAVADWLRVRGETKPFGPNAALAGRASLPEHNRHMRSVSPDTEERRPRKHPG